MLRIALAAIFLLLIMPENAAPGGVGTDGGAVLDTDGDGIPDVFDNCLLVPQTPSTVDDTDQDGFGNVCDPDFNNDLVVDIYDFSIFVPSFGFSAPPGGAATDLDVDDVTGIPDFLILRAFFGGSPGPSGLSCAGSVPCQ